ncbi:hypothetical protein EJB05_50905, partial [Eragrostis curvula]
MLMNQFCKTVAEVENLVWVFIMSSNKHSNSGQRDGLEDEEVPIKNFVEAPVRVPRAPRTSTKWPEDKIVVTAIDENGWPVDSEAKQRMRTLAGLIARQQVSLLLPNIGCLSEEAKWELFDDYVMPTLEFTDDMKPLAFKEIMKVIAHAWRTHKNNHVNNFMLKGIEPFSKHKYIKPEVWTEFVQMKSTEEFLLESEKFKNLRAQNVHNHHLGTAGYDGKITQWEAQDAKFAKEGIENPWNRYPPGRPSIFCEEGVRPATVVRSPSSHLKPSKSQKRFWRCTKPGKVKGPMKVSMVTSVWLWVTMSTEVVCEHATVMMAGREFIPDEGIAKGQLT